MSKFDLDLLDDLDEINVKEKPIQKIIEKKEDEPAPKPKSKPKSKLKTIQSQKPTININEFNNMKNEMNTQFRDLMKLLIIKK